MGYIGIWRSYYDVGQFQISFIERELYPKAVFGILIINQSLAKGSIAMVVVCHMEAHR